MDLRARSAAVGCLACLAVLAGGLLAGGAGLAVPLVGVPAGASTPTSTPASPPPVASPGAPSHLGVPSRQGGEKSGVNTTRENALQKPQVCGVLPEGGSPQGAPLLVALGASFTAGIGAGSPVRSWAVRLAEMLAWRAVTEGVPGAGYERQGEDRLGPVAKEIGTVHLAGLDPSLVIIQAGHDDAKVPPRIEGKAVERTVEMVEAKAPAAQVAVITVFTRPGRATGAQEQINATIVAAAKRADPNVIVIDPLDAHWRFARWKGLHPTSAGALVIARRVRAVLAQRGIAPGGDVAGALRAEVRCENPEQAGALAALSKFTGEGEGVSTSSGDPGSA